MNAAFVLKIDFLYIHDIIPVMKNNTVLIILIFCACACERLPEFKNESESKFIWANEGAQRLHGADRPYHRQAP